MEEWGLRARAFRELAPPPRWTRGMALDADLHAHYQRFLPVDAYLDSLHSALRTALPSPDWLPAVLRQTDPFRSVCDLWQWLPNAWDHRLTWTDADELWQLACALASPARFGTQAGRYPEQAARMRQRAWTSILDLGCGTGQGTWSLAIDNPAAQVVGVTLEPLEVWMAQHRRLPHLDLADNDAGYADVPADLRTPQFLADDVCRFRSATRFELIVCNGLAGGPAMREAAQLRALWQTIEALAAEGALVVFGHRFHDGFRDANNRLAAAAPPAWRQQPLGEQSITFHR